MDINAKIKLIAETMSGYTVLVDSSNGANVQLSKIQMPCILIFIQDAGEVLSANSHYRDSVNIRVAFLNKIPKGFKESDVETMRYALKQDMVILYHKLKFDFQFKINNETVRYEIVYDEFDDNLIGVVFNDNIKERVGLNLACDVPDSHGELPSSPSFCQKVSECSSIITINELIEGLQEQIDNLPVINTPNLQEVTDEGNTTTNEIKTNGFVARDSSFNEIATMNETFLFVAKSDLSDNLFEVDRFNDTVKILGNYVETQNNKATNFNVLNNDTYPTTQATINLVDNRVQSNIKIIGDWDATSGSYPLDDESNTTPFIVQWGSTIKAGWAFRVGYGQAGTVGGYDYENGDVVYALVDNATNSSADWGDLDHNLQQATESLRGTAKIASDLITQAGTDDERIVTSLKLKNYKDAVLLPIITNKLPIEVPQTTGVALTFVSDSVYGTIGTPETGNITFSSTGAKLGVTNIIIHNHSVAPTFGTNMKKLSGSGNYTINVVNYIYVTYINSTEVIYSINQRT